MSETGGESNAIDTLADDIDKEQLDQLHAATLKASDSCFEIKKLCATVLVPTGVLVSFFADKRLDASVFLVGIVVVAAFWFADSVGFFYQRKLRVAMIPLWERRASRCKHFYIHVPRPKPVGAFRAAFNSSMYYYLILAGALALGWTFYALGLIESPPTQSGT